MHGGQKRGFHNLTWVCVDPFFFLFASVQLVSNLEFCLYTTGISLPNPSILLRISTTIPYAVHCFCTYY